MTSSLVVTGVSWGSRVFPPDVAVEALRVPAQGMGRPGDFDPVEELLPLGPELELSRGVARVVADLEAGEHDHLDRDPVRGAAAAGASARSARPGQRARAIRGRRWITREPSRPDATREHFTRLSGRAWGRRPSKPAPTLETIQQRGSHTPVD
jgi:hypothetical protein